MQFSEKIWEKISLLWNKNSKDESLEVDDEVKYFFKDWFVVRKSLLSSRECQIDTSKAWQKMNAKAQQNKKRISIHLIRFAAVLIVGIGLTLFFIGRNNDSELLTAEGNFPSGFHKAELILSDGKTIVLDSMVGANLSAADGTNFENDFQHGELSYSSSVDSSVENKSQKLEYHTLRIPKGGDYCIKLVDGTKVWLNSESTFRFPTEFKGNGREVWLDGEGFFKVAHNENSEFTVHLPSGTVKVLGTTFNVSAYENDSKWHTVLVAGKVKVSSVNGDITLKPSDMYSVDRINGQGSLKTVDTDLYTSWVDGKFYFNAYPFEEIVKKLERWYDFEMLYQDEGIKNMHFTGTINKHRPMDDVLHFLEKTTDIHFEINGKTIIVSKTH